MKFKSETQVAEYFIKNIKKYGFRQSASQHKIDCQRFLEFLENFYRNCKKEKTIFEIHDKKDIEEKIQDLKQVIKLYEQEGI